MNVVLTTEQIAYATSVAHLRNENAIKAYADSHKHGFRGNNLQIHIEGALAEMAAAKALGLQWDDGPWKRVSSDVGSLQIRSTKYLTGKLIVRPVDSDEDVFVLVIARCPEFELKGWLKGKDAKRTQFLYNQNGRPPAYFVPQHCLQPMSVLECGAVV